MQLPPLPGELPGPDVTTPLLGTTSPTSLVPTPTVLQTPAGSPKGKSLTQIACLHTLPPLPWNHENERNGHGLSAHQPGNRCDSGARVSRGQSSGPT